jgi:D-alanyl-D-alanine carboxypeptidase
MASLTKMMTIFICSQIVEEEKTDIFDSMVTVPRVAACINGTIAGLREGDALNVNDLF